MASLVVSYVNDSAQRELFGSFGRSSSIRSRKHTRISSVLSLPQELPFASATSLEPSQPRSSLEDPRVRELASFDIPRVTRQLASSETACLSSIYDCPSSVPSLNGGACGVHDSKLAPSYENLAGLSSHYSKSSQKSISIVDYHTVKRHLGPNFNIVNVQKKSWHQKPKYRVLGLLIMVFLFHLLLAYVFILMERDEWDARIDEREAKQLELNKWLTKFGMTYRDMETLNDHLAEINELPSHNPWSNFQNVFMWTLTVGSTLGYGNFGPATTGGKIWCITGGLIAVVLCLALFVEIYHLQMGLWKIILRWVELRYDGFEKISNRTLDATHACIVFCNIFICSLIIFLVTKVNDAWTSVDIFYAYFQLWTTVGFGDLIFFAGGEGLGNVNSALLWIIFPVFMFGFALFPVLIIMIFNTVKDIFIKCFKPCCANETYKTMKSFTQVNGGIEMPRRSIYLNYTPHIEMAKKSLAKRKKPPVQPEIYSDPELSPGSMQSRNYWGSVPELDNPEDADTLHSIPCIPTPRTCLTMPSKSDSVWTVNEFNEPADRKSNFKEKMSKKSHSHRLLSASQSRRSIKFASNSDPCFNAKVLPNSETILPDIQITCTQSCLEPQETQNVINDKSESLIKSADFTACFIMSDDNTSTDLDSEQLELGIDPASVSTISVVSDPETATRATSRLPC